jgi:hypothetical protein
MIKTFLTLSFILLFLQGYATNVSGLISANTTWTKANSPYIVTGNIAIDTPATLTIEPGVEVRFDGAYIMYAYGRIIADGNVADSIMFTSNKTAPKSGDWKGIEVFYSKANDTLVFDYCSFKHSDDAALYVRSNCVKLTNSTFSNNKTGFKNLSQPNAFAFISNCTFHNNTTAIHLGGPAIAENNNIGYNDWGINNTGPNCIAKNNKVYFNAYGIIGPIHIEGNTVAYSTILGVEGRGTVTQNQIWYNKIGLRHVGGNLVEKNGFKHNYIAINGDYSVNPTHNLNNNCISNSTSYDYVNYSTFSADISQNYWGTTDSLTISTRIFDFYDNLTSGKSAFMPPLQDKDIGCLDTISLPIPITTSINEAINILNNNVIAYPNPATDNITFTCGKRIDMVVLYDMTGKEVYRQQCSSNAVSINTSAFVAGIFTYKVITESNAVSGKFVKQ